MQRAGSILKRFIKDYGLETGLTLERIKAEWASLVGETIAAHTSPHTIKGKRIFITVDTPQWMHHLSFYKQEILEKLKPYKLEDLRLRIGSLPQPLHIERKDSVVSLTEKESRYIEETIKDIKDEELKEKFRVLLAHAITKGKR